ncbi:hypothetical protein ACF0H2_08170 [Serratia marcescens]
MPLLLGGGIPLFGTDGQEQRLRLLAVTSSDNGFVQERYAFSARRNAASGGGRRRR